jgi:hypothetical protein
VLISNGGLAVRTTAAGAAPEQDPPRSEVLQPLFKVEPVSCGGRIDPDQDWVPDWLVNRIDRHVWPSASPLAVARKARTVCSHVDWWQVWSDHPELFDARQQVGAPPPAVLWETQRALAAMGTELCFDVELEDVGDGNLGLAVYGAGVVGKLTQSEWDLAAPLLTTCTARVHQPRRDVDLLGLVRPARPVIPVGRHRRIAGVRPASWEIGDWVHTWWSYPVVGSLRDKCECSAHTSAAARVHFGPGVLRASA